MTDILKPRDAKDVEDAVAWALSEGKTLEIAGQGSKRGLGRPSQSDLTLDLSGLTGVTLYEPEELVLSARAGTPISEIADLVAASGQELAFEPADYGPLLGGASGRGTLGGVIATNLSGPRRIKAGAARDHFLGVSAVSGRGETFKSGGRVVKNVTGYDLCKLMAGSYGTLGAMTDITIKTLPRSETEATVLVSGLDPVNATRAMADAMCSSCDVSAASYVPAGLGERIGVSGGKSATLFRVEGVPPSVSHRVSVLAALLKRFGSSETLIQDASRTLWHAIRDVMPLADGSDMPVWRISTAPMQGATLAASIAAESGGSWYLDWGGGLIWLSLPASDDAGAAKLRPLVAQAGGHATLIRAPAAIRAAFDVFEPQSEGVAALSRRVKESFDPKRILNPGRMWAGV